MDLDEAKLAEYQEGARRRREAREEAQAERRARALALAREAARFLRETHGVTRVAVFGSAARGRFFDEHSDLDLAVWDLDERLHFRAQGQVLGLDPDIEIDLVRYEDASPALREAIDREIDGSVSRGPDWHRDLLIQMSAEVPSTRPAAISRASWICLDDYRGFGHVVRNVYAFPLREVGVRELGGGLRACHDALSHDLDAFCAFLERTAS